MSFFYFSTWITWSKGKKYVRLTFESSMSQRRLCGVSLLWCLWARPHSSTSTERWTRPSPLSTTDIPGQVQLSYSMNVPLHVKRSSLLIAVMALPMFLVKAAKTWNRFPTNILTFFSQEWWCFFLNLLPSILCRGRDNDMNISNLSFALGSSLVFSRYHAALVLVFSPEPFWKINYSKWLLIIIGDYLQYLKNQYWWSIVAVGYWFIIKGTFLFPPHCVRQNLQ